MRTLAELENVKMGDMTPAEREAVIRAACAKLKTELERNAPAIAEVLNAPR